MGIIFKNLMDLVNQLYSGIFRAVLCSEAILAAKKQVIGSEIRVNLVVNNSFIKFGNNVQKRYGSIVSKIGRFPFVF